MAVAKRSMSLGLTLIAGVVFTNLAAAEDWPHWRGPTGMGHSSAKNLPVTWGGKANDNILWKAQLLVTDDKVRLDNNQSSPIALGGRVFVTMSYWPSSYNF